MLLGEILKKEQFQALQKIQKSLPAEKQEVITPVQISEQEFYYRMKKLIDVYRRWWEIRRTAKAEAIKQKQWRELRSLDDILDSYVAQMKKIFCDDLEPEILEKLGHRRIDPTWDSREYSQLKVQFEKYYDQWERLRKVKRVYISERRFREVGAVDKEMDKLVEKMRQAVLGF